MKTRTDLRKRRQLRIRAVIKGSKLRPRVAVFRSNTTLSVQFIDDQKGVTLFTLAAKGKNKLAATELGKNAAAQALKNGVKAVVFDRGGYRYHGSIAAIADALRQGGLTL